MKKQDLWNKPVSLRKNQVVTVDITDMTREGEGVGKYAGFPVFVKDTVTGDRAEILITKIKKNYGYGRLHKLLTASPDRVDPPCPSARQCGGCRIQQIRYEKQLDMKLDHVRNCLERIGGFDPGLVESVTEGITGMEEPWHFRNKAQYPVGTDRQGNPVTGFYAGRTHTIIPNTDCLIQDPVNEKILKTVLAHMKRFRIPAYDEEKGKGLVRHIFTRIGKETGQIMVCLVINGSREQLAGSGELVHALRQIPGMESILVNSNRKKTNVIMGDHTETLWGNPYIEDRLDGLTFRIGPRSFYQVNPEQTVKLYGKAMEYASLTGSETVWDLYCGIGTISLFLSRKAGRVIGVEVVPEAIEDARVNAGLNGIGNVEFHVGKAEEIAPDLCRDSENRPDVVVVDPPRKGCDGTLLDAILSMEPERIVYVSCDPATLARDLKILCAGGYDLSKAAAVDQFCHSMHVESVCLLTHKD